MSVLRRKRSGTRRAALVTALTLGAFQVLAVIGATSAAAAVTCDYNPVTDTVTVNLTAGGDAATLTVDSTTGEILVNGTACSTATITNTTDIVVIGAPGDQTVTIDNAADGEFPTTITWTIDLGTGAADTLALQGADGVDNTLTVTDASFTINGGTAADVAGVELFTLTGGDGADTLDASGLTDGVATLVGNAGDDTLTGGPNDDTLLGGDDNDTLDGGDGDDAIGGGLGDDTVIQGAAIDGNDTLTDAGGFDTLDYSARTGAIIVDAGAGESGEDANSDGDLADTGDELDVGAGAFEAFFTGTGNDTLTGDADDEWFSPGDGNDTVDGNGGTDTVDYSTSSVGVTIDPAAGTATGQGDDTLADVEDFVGSEFDDTLVFDGTTVSFDGLGGVDTVDASADTGGLTIDLEVNFPNAEAAIGGSGDDLIIGNAFSNVLMGGDGNDTIEGRLGNDWIEGGLGNDVLDGEEGADTVAYVNAANGVEVDNSLLFATGDGEDAFGSAFEVIVGSEFDDQILTGQTADLTNQRVKGKGGNDSIVGSNGSDILGGGRGNDNIRAGSGDDTLKGGAGKDRLTAGTGDDILRGGKGRDTGNGGRGDDQCRSIEKKKSC